MNEINNSKIIDESTNTSKHVTDNKKSSNRFELVRDVVFIIAAFFGILAFFRTCMTENRLEEVTYRLASMDHQPKLKIANVKSSVHINTLSVKAEEKALEHEGSKDDPHPFKVNLAFSAEITVKIKNVGDSAIGKIRLFVTTDQSVNFKKFVTDKAYRKNSEVHFNEWPELTNLQILPGDIAILNANAVIKRPEEEKFVMHIIIIYENDFGNFYHTHARIPFEFEPMHLKTTREMKISELEKELREYTKQKLLNNELMKVGTVISTYSIYDENESQKVKDYILSFKKGS